MGASPWVRRAGLALVLGLVAAVLPRARPALAEDTPEPDPRRKAEASAHLKRGAELIDREDLEGALAEFEAAYRLVPSPSILHNFGVVYQGMGRKAAALEVFERFLAEAPRAPAATREHAQRAAQILRGEVATLRLESDVAGAAVFIDGRKVAETPQKAPIYLDPGPHHLSVDRPGGGTVHDQRILAGAGEQLTVTTRALPPPAPAVEEVAAGSPPPSRDWQRPAAWASAALAAVAAGGFTTAVLVRYQRFTEFNDKGCGTRELEKYPVDCGPLLERGRNAETWAKITGAAAGALAVGSALLFLTAPDGPLDVSLQASPSRLGVGVRGRF